MNTQKGYLQKEIKNKIIIILIFNEKVVNIKIIVPQTKGSSFKTL